LAYPAAQGAVHTLHERVGIRTRGEGNKVGLAYPAAQGAVHTLGGVGIRTRGEENKVGTRLPRGRCIP
jgi:hypothetical protein